MLEDYSEILIVPEIMIILKICKNSAYYLIKQGYFPVIKIKGTYRIPKKGFYEWLERNTNGK